MNPRVLILEYNFILFEGLADLVWSDLTGTPIFAVTVANAIEPMDDNIVFSFLDIDLPDGSSYPVAKKLLESGIPVVFAAGNERGIVPKEFRKILFVAKPASVDNLVQLAKSLSSAFK